jgi:hypothetical protein
MRKDRNWEREITETMERRRRLLREKLSLWLWTAAAIVVIIFIVARCS